MAIIKEQKNLIKKTLSKIAGSPYRFVSTLVICLIFIIVFSMNLSNYGMQIMENVGKMNDIVSESTQNLPLDFSGDIDSLTPLMKQQRQIDEYLGIVTRLMFFLILFSYIAFCIFIGSNWFLTHTIASKKSLELKKKIIDYLYFMLNFSLINIVWLLLFVILVSFWGKFSVANKIATLSVVSQPVINIPFFLLSLVLAYFVFLSYALIPKRNILQLIRDTFVFGFKKVKDLLIMYLIISLSLIISFFILYFSFKFSVLAFILLALIFFIPLISLIRLFIICTVDRF